MTTGVQANLWPILGHLLTLCSLALFAKALLSDFSSARGKAERSVAVGLGLGAATFGVIAHIVGSALPMGASFAMVAMLLSLAVLALMYALIEDTLVDIAAGTLSAARAAVPSAPVQITHLEAMPGNVTELEAARVTHLRH
jgi:hypothetical protein